MAKTEKPKPLLGDADKKELITAFIDKMIDITYTPEFIGEQLAVLIWAIDNPISP